MIERLLNLDRRIIFVLMAIMVGLPFFTKIVLDPGENPRSRDLFDFIEDELNEGDVVIVSFNYGPASMPELNPMARAVIYHALSRDRRVMTLTLIPEGAILADDILNEIGKELGKKKGEDYVNLGFRPGFVAVILGMASDISQVFATDFEGTPYNKLKVAEGVRDYDDVAIVVDLASSDTPATWIIQAHERYGVNIGAGVTAVMAQDYYPYLQTGQLVGLLNGLKGAAEYEAMVDRPGDAIRGMGSQSLAQLLIIVMVIFINVIYFISRRRAREE